MKYKTTLSILLALMPVLILQVQMGFVTKKLIECGALYVWVGYTGEWWRVLTYGLLHNNIRHFILNFIILVLALSYFEHKTNSKTALIIFISGIVFGGIGFLIFNTVPRIATTGASGGIWGLYGATMALVITNIKRFKGIEIYLIIVFTALAFYDTITATNVNYISHYSAYITGFILIGIMQLISIIKTRNTLELRSD